MPVAHSFLGPYPFWQADLKRNQKLGQLIPAHKAGTRHKASASRLPHSDVSQTLDLLFLFGHLRISPSALLPK
jgi:hypothetical protein